MKPEQRPILVGLDHITGLQLDENGELVVDYIMTPTGECGPYFRDQFDRFTDRYGNLVNEADGSYYLDENNQPIHWSEYLPQESTKSTRAIMLAMLLIGIAAGLEAIPDPIPYIDEALLTALQVFIAYSKIYVPFRDMLQALETGRQAGTHLQRYRNHR